MLQLQRIKEDYRKGLSEPAALDQINALLRRILISYQGREVSAAATGKKWLDQIEALSSRPAFDQQQLEMLAFTRYQPNPETDVSALLKSCESWIRGLPRGRHVSD